MGDDLLEIKWEDSTKRVNYLLEYKGQQLYKGKFIYEKDNVKNIIFDGLFNLETEEVISGQVMQFFNSTRVKYSGKINQKTALQSMQLAVLFRQSSFGKSLKQPIKLLFLACYQQ